MEGTWLYKNFRFEFYEKGMEKMEKALNQTVTGLPVDGAVQPEVKGEGTDSKISFTEGGSGAAQNVDTNVNSQNLGSGSSGAYAQIDSPNSREAGLDF